MKRCLQGDLAGTILAAGGTSGPLVIDLYLVHGSVCVVYRLLSVSPWPLATRDPRKDEKKETLGD